MLVIFYYFSAILVLHLGCNKIFISKTRQKILGTPSCVCRNLTCKMESVSFHLLDSTSSQSAHQGGFNLISAEEWFHFLFCSSRRHKLITVKEKEIRSLCSFCICTSLSVIKEDLVISGCLIHQHSSACQKFVKWKLKSKSKCLCSFEMHFKIQFLKTQSLKMQYILVFLLLTCDKTFSLGADSRGGGQRKKSQREKNKAIS